MAGPENNIPLCLDCSLKLQAYNINHLAELERASNVLVEQMESIGGVQLGGKFPPRPRPMYVGKTVFNNIKITESQIGVLNTGTIGAIDAAITVVRNNGADDVARGLAAFTEAIAKDTELLPDQRRDAMELVNALASEAASPPAQRRRSVARALTVDIAQLISGAASLVQLWQMYGPTILSHFGLGG